MGGRREDFYKFPLDSSMSYALNSLKRLGMKKGDYGSYGHV